MKKSFLRIAAVAAVLLPLSAFALEPMQEAQMDAITAQAGVSIAVDNVKLYQKFDRISWIDTDADGGAINLLGVEMANFTIDALVDAADVLNSTGVTDATGFVAQALSIDIENRLPTLSAGMEYNLGAPAGAVNVAGVAIGLPTIVINRDITIDNITITSAGAANSGATFGSLEFMGAQLAILGGTLEIAPH